MRNSSKRRSWALGHEIEIISGHEEARLIYLGVAHTVQGDKRRLVVDIGGGSTECVIGEAYDTLETDSLHMGCVNFSRRFFEDGRVTSTRFVEAENAAALELHSMKNRYRERGWKEAIGCSGTILALDLITRENGFSSGGITLGALDKVRDSLIVTGNMKKTALSGLRDERRNVLPGGLSILRSVFRHLGVERMEASDAALREGALYELRGRIEHADIRDLTVAAMMARFHVDPAQADRVERTALQLYDQLEEPWISDASVRQMLSWACRLHEIGISISHSGNHHHAAYLVRHSDMDGFSIDAKAVLAAMVECHRRKLRKEPFEALPPERVKDALRGCIVLRLARKLNRARLDGFVPDVQLSAHKKKLKLSVPQPWLEQNTVTAMDLVDEVNRLSQIGYSLEIVKT